MKVLSVFVVGLILSGTVFGTIYDCNFRTLEKGDRKEASFSFDTIQYPSYGKKLGSFQSQIYPNVDGTLGILLQRLGPGGNPFPQSHALVIPSKVDFKLRARLEVGINHYARMECAAKD